MRRWHALFMMMSIGWMVSAVSSAEDIKIACVGDSITYGAGTSNPAKASYPSQLAGILGAGFQIGNFGHSGATLLNNGDLPYIKVGEYKKATDFAPDVVLIKLGTNDSKPQNWKNKANFEKDLEALVDHFAALPSKPKIWLVIPVPAYGVNYGISGTVIEQEVIPMIKAVAQKKGLPTIDLFTALSNHADMFPDKIHPNDAGAKLMAEEVARVLKEALAKK